MSKPKGYMLWRESQRPWAALQAKYPRRNWFQLALEHYDYLYPKP